MVRLRKFVCYRTVKRPYTRKSKYRRKSFVRGAPTCKVVKFNVGNLNTAFQYRVDLVSKDKMQMRDNAIESGRQTCNRLLEKIIGKNGFRLQVRPYPHHVLREHALAAGAGADRFSSGMAHPFGKPAGNAVQMRVGQKIFSVFVNEGGLATARAALKKAHHKVPFHGRIIVNKL